MRYWIATLTLVILLTLAGCRQPQPDQRPTTPPAATTAAPSTEAMQWLTNLEEGQKQAAAQGKPLLVDFFATWCGPCQMMEQTTWPDSKVRGAARGYVLVRIDIDKAPAVAKQYAVEGVPTMLFLSPSGELKYRQVGFTDAADMTALLGEYRQ